MTMSLRIAAIIPVYNRPTLILDAMMSVARQTHPPACMIVVDDGSSDETASIARAWIKDMQLPFECTLIEQPNQGVAAARNAGVQAAGDCDLLAFLDSDDLWPESYLQRMADCFAANPDAVACSSDRVDHDRRQPKKDDHHDLRWVSRDTTAHMLEHGSPGTPNTVIKRSVYQAIGGYDPNEKCGEDYQLFLRISLKGQWCHVPGQPVMVRRGLQSSTDGAAQLSRQFDDRRLRLAKILDRFIHDDGGKDVVDEHVWKKRVGRLYFAAGRTALKQQNHDVAKQALEKAKTYLPGHLRTRWLLWKLGK